jgi:predicted nucleic acid-binding protein
VRGSLPQAKVSARTKTSLAKRYTTAMRFVDTNVLLYSVSPLAGDADKCAVAVALLQAPDLVISVQVLQEFYVQATRPSRSHALTHDDAVALISCWLRFPVQEMSVAVFQAALSAKQRFQISFWDAAIIEAARAAGCRQVLSEDLNPGQDYGGLTVINPFAT